MMNLVSHHLKMIIVTIKNHHSTPTVATMNLISHLVNHRWPPLIPAFPSRAASGSNPEEVGVGLWRHPAVRRGEMMPFMVCLWWVVMMGNDGSWCVNKGWLRSWSRSWLRSWLRRSFTIIKQLIHLTTIRSPALCFVSQYEPLLTLINQTH